MEGLYSLSKAQFHQLATHISLYHEDASPGYRSLGEESLRLAGLRPERFVFWNVPSMGSFFGSTVPVDVHGGHVLVDESAAPRAATCFGVLRYAYLSAAVRVAEGGRWRYDFATMNVTLGVGAAGGAALLSAGRRRVAWMRRRPVGAVAVGAAACVALTVSARWAMRAFGVGVVAAQNAHRRALVRLDCADCLDDVGRHNATEAEALRQQPIPRPPGTAELPAAYVRQFERNRAAQALLLEADAKEVHALRRRLAGRVCPTHRELRGGTEPKGAPLLQEDVRRARERVAAEAKEEPNPTA